MGFLHGAYGFNAGGSTGSLTLAVGPGSAAPLTAPTSGNTLILSIESTGTTSTVPTAGWITSITDDSSGVLSTTYIQPTGGFVGFNEANGNGVGVWMYYCQTVGTNVTTITIHFTTTAGTSQLIAAVVEYSGLGAFDIAGALAHTQTSATTANSITSTAGTTTANGDTIIGLCQTIQQAIDMSAGTTVAFASRYHVADFVMIEDYTQPALGSISVAFTPGGTTQQDWGAGMLAFLPGATAVPGAFDSRIFRLQQPLWR